MATFEEEVAERGFSFRPPRSVMKGGLTRAAMAGQQATNAGIAGGASGSQMRAAMSPELESFTAQLRASQLKQNFGQVLTQARTLSYVDTALDRRASEDAFYNERNRTTWDEAIIKGAAVANVLSGVAGLISDKGTKVVDKEVFVDKNGDPIPDNAGAVNFTKEDMRDQGGNVVQGNRRAPTREDYLQSHAQRDFEGKPIKLKQQEIEKSAAAQTADRVQDALGKVFPGIRRYNDSKRQALADSIDIFNTQRKEGMMKMFGRHDEAAALREQLAATKELNEALRLAAVGESEVLAGFEETVARHDAQIRALADTLGTTGQKQVEELPSAGAFDPILSLLFKHEAGKAGFNAYNNLVIVGKDEKGKNILDYVEGPRDIRRAAWNVDAVPLEEMTLGQVKLLQAGGPPLRLNKADKRDVTLTKEERKAFAVGLGQFIPSTLDSVATFINMSDSEKMSRQNQIRLIVGYMMMEPNIADYLNSTNPSHDMLLAAADRFPQMYASVKTRKGTGKHDSEVNYATVDYDKVVIALTEVWALMHQGSTVTVVGSQ